MFSRQLISVYSFILLGLALSSSSTAHAAAVPIAAPQIHCLYCRQPTRLTLPEYGTHLAQHVAQPQTVADATQSAMFKQAKKALISMIAAKDQRPSDVKLIFCTLAKNTCADLIRAFPTNNALHALILNRDGEFIPATVESLASRMHSQVRKMHVRSHAVSQPKLRLEIPQEACHFNRYLPDGRIIALDCQFCVGDRAEAGPYHDFAYYGLHLVEHHLISSRFSQSPASLSVLDFPALRVKL